MIRSPRTTEPLATAAAPTAPVKLARARRWRLFWMQQIRCWHWMSSALCLVALIGFAATGFTLNHASQIKAEPKVVSRQAMAPAPVVLALTKGPKEGTAALPPPVRAWIRRALAVD